MLREKRMRGNSSRGDASGNPLAERLMNDLIKGNRDARLGAVCTIVRLRDEIGTSDSLRLLSIASKDRREKVRRAAIIGLGHLGIDAVPELGKGLDCDNLKESNLRTGLISGIIKAEGLNRATSTLCIRLVMGLADTATYNESAAAILAQIAENTGTC